MSSPDFTEVNFGDHQRSVSSDKLKQLSDLVKEMEHAEREVEIADLELKRKKKRLDGIVQHDLPELMLELGQPVLHTSDGRKIEIKDVVRATLPEAARPAGHRWLIDNGHAGLVKRTVEVAFAAVEGEKAQELLGSMEQEYGANARQVMKVEPATLTAFVKRQLKAQEADDYEGPKIPTEIFNVAEFKHAKVSKKKG